jgi:hypothetical protein
MSCLRLNLENNAADPVAGQGDFGAGDRRRIGVDICRMLAGDASIAFRVVFSRFGFELPELMGHPDGLTSQTERLT